MPMKTRTTPALMAFLLLLPVMLMACSKEDEAAAAFDELTRSGKDDQMVRQIRNAWPNVFRAARFIPAVENMPSTQRSLSFLSMLSRDLLLL